MSPHNSQGSETQFYEIVAKNPVGIVVIGTDGLPRFANSAADTLFDSRIIDMATPLFESPVTDGGRRDLAIIRGDGRHIIIQAQLVDIVWDDEPAFLVSLQEITQHEQVASVLRESEETIRFQADLLEMIQQAVIAVDLDGKIIYRNRFAETLYGWPSTRAGQDTAGDSPALDSAESPWTQELDIIARASRERPWSGELLVHNMAGTVFPALITASAVRDEVGERVGTVITSMDIAQQKETEHQLERYVKRLENLRKIDKAILVAQSPATIADAALQQIRQLLPCPRASVTLFDPATQSPVILAVQTDQETQVKAGAIFSPPDKANLERLRRGQLEISEDIRSEKWPRPILTALQAEGIRSYVRVPLITKGELIGALNLGAASIDVFAPERLDVAREVADHLAIALQNARLHEEVLRYTTELEERVRARTTELSEANRLLQTEVTLHQRTAAAEHDQRSLAEALSDIAMVLNKSLDLDQVLDQIFLPLNRVVPYDAAEILLIEDDGTAHVARSLGLALNDDELGRLQAYQFSVVKTPNLHAMFESGKPFLIPDLREYSHWIELPVGARPASCVGAPIYGEKAVAGFLILMSNTYGFFTEQHADRLQTFAHHAAVAIQNARLYRQAQELAVIEERQRLARELHDSVSQTLWSASLIADVLPDLWEQNPVDARQASRRLRQLARGALAEMRMLLWELHPTALTEVRLDELIQRLVEVTTSRTGIPVTPVIDGQPGLPPGVQVAIYRIAQEALGNVARHAAASQIVLKLRWADRRLDLFIKDNGHGFVPERVQPGHFGLGIMRERARSIGAELSIETDVGQGTEVTLTWSAQNEANQA